MQNYIYAKVKRKQNLFRVIASDTNIYDPSTFTLNGVEYNPSTLTEEEELYKLSDFSSSQFSLDFLSGDLDSVNYNQINKADLAKLSFICTIQQDLYFFQIINSNGFISKKWFSIEELTLEANKPIITINPFADAIYDKKDDTLYFKKLSVANRIFKGMDQLYRSATDDETEQFLESEFLEVNAGFGKENVTIPNRKRIALVSETLSRFSDDEKQAVYDYTNQYGKVTYSNGKFKIESDEDLKFVLWGIEQRFYTTQIGGEKRIANSVISIS
jgi:hypothetical protein